jgi:ribonucleotide reductase alpha subunit
MNDFSNLAKVVLARTYARPINNRVENWDEIVERVITGNVQGHNVSEKEIERLRYFLLNRKASPAGRGLWISGTPVQKKIGGAALTNCWGFVANDWEKFVVIADLLMLGGGVGVSVEKEYVTHLPKVKSGVIITHHFTKDADYIVPDSREGWCRLIYKTLEAWFVTGKGFTYSTVCVRGAGELIHGFGGISSGPRPLIRLIEKLCSIFVTRTDKKLRPIDVADVICCIAEMVVSGNVRRSAILIQGDANDKLFLKAKRWDLGTLPTQRSNANFSVVADDAENDLTPLFWETYAQGEPFGIINLENIRKYGRIGELKEDNAVVVNPCQPAWATVLTPKGLSTIGQINIGDTIWSGKRWTKVTNKVYTGKKEVFEYRTRTGIFNGTKNHRIVSYGQKIEVDAAKAIDQCLGLINNSQEITTINPQHVIDGMVIGDGFTHKASNDLTLLCIGKDDECIINNTEISFLLKKERPGVSKFAWEVTTDLKSLPKTYDRYVPVNYKYGDSATVRGFLRGLYSANGSVVSNRITLKAASFCIIKDVQEMLSSLGITSYYTINKATTVKFNNGTYDCKQSYDLNIIQYDSRLLFQKLIGFVHQYKNEKLDKVIKTVKKANKNKTTFEIKEIIPKGVEDVWDLTVDDVEHTYWTGCLLVSNCSEASLWDGESCNLQDINLPKLNNIMEFAEAAKLMHRWGKRVSLEKYHWPATQEVVNKNHRIGTGITGCLQRLDLFCPEVLDYVYNIIQEENVSYSKELNIPPSIKTTVIKPSGTLSKVFDSSCEGIHPAYSRYIIQRIRIATNDPIMSKLQKAGHHIEALQRYDGTLDPDTMVVDFPVKVPDDVPCSDEGFGMDQQLEAIKMAQKHWADQSISVTVYYKDEDISKIKSWLKDNLSEIKTVSFLKYSGHGFIQAPKQPITEKEYNKLASKLKPIDFEEIQEGKDLDGLECSSGACPIK